MCRELDAVGEQPGRYRHVLLLRGGAPRFLVRLARAHLHIPHTPHLHGTAAFRTPTTAQRIAIMREGLSPQPLRQSDWNPPPPEGALGHWPKRAKIGQPLPPN
jgi:hypothetical protein